MDIGTLRARQVGELETNGPRLGPFLVWENNVLSVSGRTFVTAQMACFWIKSRRPENDQHLPGMRLFRMAPCYLFPHRVIPRRLRMLPLSPGCLPAWDCYRDRLRCTSSALAVRYPKALDFPRRGSRPSHPSYVARGFRTSDTGACVLCIDLEPSTATGKWGNQS